MQISPKSTLLQDTNNEEDGHWRDVPCSKRNLIVCETKPIFSVPELRDIMLTIRDNPGI